MSNELENGSGSDEEFDEYLQRGSDVSQRYRELVGRDVPPALDAKVLRQAQQQSEEARKRKARAWLRWGAPLALAATALIAVTVVLQPGVQEAAAPSTSRASAPSPAAAAEPQSNIIAANTDKMNTEERALTDRSDLAVLQQAQAPNAAAPQPPASAARDSDQVFLERKRRGFSSADEGDSRLKETPKESKDSSRSLPPLVSSSTNASRQRIYVQEPAPASGALAPAAPAVSANAAQNVPATQAPPAAEAAGTSKHEMESDAGSSVTTPRAARSAAKSESPTTQVAPPPSPVSDHFLAERKSAQPTKPKAEAKHHDEAGETRNYATYNPTVPREEAFAVGLRDTIAAAPSNVAADRAIAPDVWVKWIRELRSEGKGEVAETFLKRLRAAHPEFQVPSDIAPAVKR